MDNCFSLSQSYFYVLASVQCKIHSHNDKSFTAIPNMPGGVPLDKSGLGSSYATTRAQTTLQLALRELQCVQCIVINKNIAHKQLILVFLLHFSVSLEQNTTSITTATTMAAASKNDHLRPHMRPCALC